MPVTILPGDMQRLTENVTCTPLDIASLGFPPTDARVAIDIVERTGFPSTLVVNYHAGSQNDEQRATERDWIAQSIQSIMDSQDINDCVLQGDFNENFFTQDSTTSSATSVFNPVLAGTIIPALERQSMTKVVSIAAPDVFIHKQRGTFDGSRYLGPNFYLNQQAQKDGEAVYDTKVGCIHFQRNTMVQFDFSSIPVPRETLRFGSDPTGGSDHPSAQFTVNGVRYIAGGCLPTEGRKAAQRLDSIYVHPPKNQEELLPILHQQAASTKILYECFTEEFGVTLESDFNQDIKKNKKVITDCREAFINAMTKDREDTQSRMERVLTKWAASEPFKLAQRDLRADSFKPRQLILAINKNYTENIDSPKKIDPFSCIAEALKAQPNSGYMPLSQSDHTLVQDGGKGLEREQFQRMVELAKAGIQEEGAIYMCHTEAGADSKPNPNLRAALSEEIEPVARTKRYREEVRHIDDEHKSKKSTPPEESGLVPRQHQILG